MSAFIQINRSFFQWFLFAILSLIAIDIVGYILQFSGPFTYLLRITTEKNPATLVATVQLILSAQFAFFVQSKLKVGGESQGMQGFWKVLGIVFYILAFDEWISIHDPLGKLFADQMGGAGDLLNWTILYIPLVGIFGLWSVRFLIQLPRNIAFMMILSGIIFCFGAVGLELLNKQEFQQLLSVSLSESYQFGVGVLEESCEMLGILLFNFCVYQYVVLKQFVPLNINTRVHVWVVILAFIDMAGTLFARLFL